jgi:hypothetical protein
MGFSLKGYILEPPRVGQANSPFTFTPNDFISDQAAFDAAYPNTEANPPTQYLVQVMQDGDLPDAIFGWTKNEVIARFDYAGSEQRFKTLPGKGLEVLGQLGPTSNTNRLIAFKPLDDDLATYPLRVSVGSTGSGTTFTPTVVLSFGSPGVGAVEILESTGELNWNAADLVSFNAQEVRFQRQTFFAYAESNGKIGVIDDILFLNPLPATGQYPLLRIAFGPYLTPVEVANDAGLLPLPASGSVKWSMTTGRLAFNQAVDVSGNTGKAIYYDGVLMEGDRTFTPISVGTLTAPGVLPLPLPPEESDVFFRVVGTVQFPQTKFVPLGELSNGKRGIVEIERTTGQVQFSQADQDAYGAVSAQAFIPNLDIERGISLELFRTPIDPAATDPTTKDVSAFYATSGAILADPIIASPTVLLPATPVDAPQIVVSVISKSGTTSVLPRLDVPVPPVGLGCVIDSESRALLYAQRKALVVIPTPLPYGAVSLPDPLVFTQNLVVGLETAPNSGIYPALTLGEDYLIDTGSGTVSLVETDGTLVTSGSGGTFAGTAFTDAGADWLPGVLTGDTLLVTNGLSVGVYTVASVGSDTALTTDIPGISGSNLTYEIRRGEEILADRFFKPISPLDPNTKVERIVALGVTTNSPRYSVPLSYASSTKTRFRFGPSTFSTAVNVVPSFGSPAQGVVEIKDTTGELNFSSADVTAALTVYWVRTLALGTEYTIQPPLGFIQFNDRFLAEEEAIITYKNSNAPDTLIVEQATFLVRKETTAPHPAPTSVLTFNPLGRPVATNPPPRVFRGGRPQVNGVQCIVNTVASTITFLSDGTVTNALPHGPTVNPTENVYIDYYVTKAIGGESNITVLQPPMATGVIQTYGGIPLVLLGNGIASGGTQFTIPGDRTADFLAESLLRVNGDRQELYLIGSSTFNAGPNNTTVVLATPQEFQSDNSVPNLFVTSGPTRLVAAFPQPAYFVTEAAVFQSVPRGSNKIRLTGDLTGTYTLGKVLLFTDGVYTDFYQVNGSTFSESSGFTEVQITANTQRQYPPPSGPPVTLKRSVRSILESSTKVAQTSHTPVLTLPYTVYRRVEGQVGVLLSQPDGYQINDSGAVTFATALQDRESWDILYTGYTTIQAGRRIQASYTFHIVPSEANGLLGSTLVADYTTYAPDTFFYRVETFTNFRGELAVQWQKDAQASIPSGGPILSNMSAPKLYEQGRESLFFQEGHLANEDIVARATLKFYNDAVNLLEDVLQDMDGRVVGDRDGRFLFDGLIDNPPRTTFATVTNQIDDLLKVSPAPYTVTGPPWIVTSVGTYIPVYLESAVSRFFPTQRARYNATVPPAGLNDGDPILDTKSTNLTLVSGIQNRVPWAVLTLARTATATILEVDYAQGNEYLLRPAFTSAPAMDVRIEDSNAVVYVASATVSGVTPTQITLSAPVGVSIPAGATVFLNATDPFHQFYRLGIDVGVDLKAGQLTHVVPTFPWVPPTNNPANGEALDLTAQITPLNIAPDRFPALDGLTTDDDGDRQLPVLTPYLNSEAPLLNGSPSPIALGHLGTELTIIRTSGPTGTLRSATTAPYMDTGTTCTATVLTAALAFPGTVKQWDLVSFLSGPNAGNFYQIDLAPVGNTLTVTGPLIPDATPRTITVTASASLVTSTAAVTSTTTTVVSTGPPPNFLTSGVLPGHTVVLTTGPSAGERRQVLTVTTTVITVSTAFSTTASLQGYRVDNPLGTFYGVGSIWDQLTTAISAELGILAVNIFPIVAERPAIEDFYNTVFTDVRLPVATGTAGATTIGLPTLTDATANFSEVLPGDYVYIRGGPANPGDDPVAGIYKVLMATSLTTLDIEATFPATLTGITYRVVKATGVTEQSLTALFTVLQAIDTWVVLTLLFKFKATTLVPVFTASFSPDPNIVALGWLTADLNSRETDVLARITAVDATSPGSDADTVSSVLSSGDRIYDQRFTWIDARINRQTGIIVKQSRAVVNRLKAQEDILKQLTKLLTAP